jgi:hypothetical protein
MLTWVGLWIASAWRFFPGKLNKQMIRELDFQSHLTTFGEGKRAEVELITSGQ